MLKARFLTFPIVGIALWGSHSFALVGLGSFSTDIHEYQKNRKAERRSLDYSPFLSLHHNWKWTERHEIVPELGMAWHPSTSPNNSRMSIFLLYALSSRIWKEHRAHYGFGNLITRSYGPGGVVTMKNGNEEDIFYQPSGSTFSHNSTVFAGYEFRLKDYWSLRLDLFVSPILDPRRSYALMMSTNLYYF